jgi:formylglycine-generating enzyme required for sulfatase activity
LPEGEQGPVARALAKKPEDRWPSCRDFVLALEACAAATTKPYQQPKLENGPKEIPGGLVSAAEIPSARPAALVIENKTPSQPPPVPGPPPIVAESVRTKGSATGRLSAADIEVIATAPVEVRSSTKLPAISQSGRFIVNAIGLRLVLVSPGEFLMGASGGEVEVGADERPQHRVRITHPFYLGIYPVTQMEFERIMGRNPSKFHPDEGGGPNHPVEKATWEEAVEFCRRLSDLPEERHAGHFYRLPTEAEWEYACRAGTTTAYHYGPALSSLQANFNGKFPYGGAVDGPFLNRTSPVGSYRANSFGLHDMHGNVWEWCADYYSPTYYRESPADDPPGPPQGDLRLVRGGSWFDYAFHCRAADRSPTPPDARYKNIGFRAAMTVTEARNR